MNIEYFKKTLKSIMDIPSPSGYTKEAMHYIQNELTQMGYTPSMNHKGNLYVKVSGCNHDHPIAFSAHCDTGTLTKSNPINNPKIEKKLDFIEFFYCQVKKFLRS